MDPTIGVTGLTAVLQQHQVQMGSQDNMPVVTQAYANYAMGPPWVSSLSELSLPPISNVGVMVFAHFLFSGSGVVTVYINGGSTIWVCTSTTLWSVPMTGVCASCVGSWPINLSAIQSI